MSTAFLLKSRGIHGEDDGSTGSFLHTCPKQHKRRQLNHIVQDKKIHSQVSKFQNITTSTIVFSSLFICRLRSLRSQCSGYFISRDIEDLSHDVCANVDLQSITERAVRDACQVPFPPAINNDLDFDLCSLWISYRTRLPTHRTFYTDLHFPPCEHFLPLSSIVHAWFEGERCEVGTKTRRKLTHWRSWIKLSSSYWPSCDGPNSIIIASKESHFANYSKISMVFPRLFQGFSLRLVSVFLPESRKRFGYMWVPCVQRWVASKI